MHLIAQVIDPYLDKFKGQEGYFTADRMRHNYFEKHPQNTELEEVRLKVSAIEDDEVHRNGAVESVARHIFSLKDLDQRLQAGDHGLISEINNVTRNRELLDLYAFATRYCNGHNEHTFPIYDRSIDLLLKHYVADTGPVNFQPDFRNYQQFAETLSYFVSDTGIHDLNFQEIDKFLWIYGDKILQELENS